MFVCVLQLHCSLFILMTHASSSHYPPSPVFVSSHPYTLAPLYTLQLNIICAVRYFLRRPRGYLHGLVALYTTVLCLVMLCVAIETPAPVLQTLERSKVTATLFSFRGRYCTDLLIALFLFAMGPWGIVAGVLTLLLIFGIRFLGVKQPDAFNEIFRQQQGQPVDMESAVGGGAGDEYTLESEYDTHVSGSRR